MFSSSRFNKLGLDKISNGEEPNPSNQVEEVHSYAPVQSAPLNSEKIVHIDIGTAHSVAVTGSKEFNPMHISQDCSFRFPSGRFLHCFDSGRVIS